MSAEWRIRLGIFGGLVFTLVALFYLPHPAKVPSTIAVFAVSAVLVTRPP